MQSDQLEGVGVEHVARKAVADERAVRVDAHALDVGELVAALGGIDSQTASIRSSASGMYQSSESIIAQNSPLARSTARFTAACLPWFSCQR